MTTAPGTILVAEHDGRLRRYLRRVLTARDFLVVEAGAIEALLALLQRRLPDVIMLDLDFPGADAAGLIAAVLAASSAPIIAFSSLNDQKVLAAALDAGADDFLHKPFGVEELLARLRTVLRRRIQQHGSSPMLFDGRLRLDLVWRRVEVAGCEIHLSRSEYAVLNELALHAGKAVPHGVLLKTIWPGDPDNPQNMLTLRVFIKNLRQKIEIDPDSPSYIETITRVGYRFNIDSARRAVGLLLGAG